MLKRIADLKVVEAEAATGSARGEDWPEYLDG
jgi:hypothetical protein